MDTNTVPNSPLAKRKVVLLKAARKVIAENQCRGVCTALYSATSNTYDTAYLELRNYIRTSLGFSRTWLEEWQTTKKCRSLTTPKKARLMWIDWMIAQLEGRKYEQPKGWRKK